MGRFITAPMLLKAGATVRVSMFEDIDGGPRLVDTAEVTNPYDGEFGPGSLLPVKFEDGEWVISITDTRPPKETHASAPVPDADPV